MVRRPHDEYLRTRDRRAGLVFDRAFDLAGGALGDQAACPEQHHGHYGRRHFGEAREGPATTLSHCRPPQA